MQEVCISAMLADELLLVGGIDHHIANQRFSAFFRASTLLPIASFTSAIKAANSAKERVSSDPMKRWSDDRNQWCYDGANYVESDLRTLVVKEPQI